MPAICPACQTSNRDAARFCVKCGAALPDTAAVLLGAGTMLQGRYKIERPINTSGKRVVYRASDGRLQRAVAVKAISSEQLSPTELQQATLLFNREAAILSHLTHPHLPRIIDYFEESGKQFLVMDVVEGESLAQKLAAQNRQPLAEAQVTEWAVALCDALAYLHGQNPPVIFRNLKPDNVIIQRDGRLKLVGFGTARIAKPNKAQDTFTFSNPGYTAPEQEAEGRSDARSDIYSLGVVMHELLTGSDPKRRGASAMPPARQLNPALSPRVAAVIQKAAQFNPVLRYDSARAMKADLLLKPEEAAAPRPINAQVSADLQGNRPPVNINLAPDSLNRGLAPSLPTVPTRVWWAIGLVVIIVVGAGALTVCLILFWLIRSGGLGV